LTVLPQPASAATDANAISRDTEGGSVMSGLLLRLVGATAVQDVDEGVGAAQLVAHLLLGDVVVGLKLEPLFVEERGGLVVVEALRRALALVDQLGKVRELGAQPRPEIAERLLKEREILVEPAVDVAEALGERLGAFGAF